VERTQRLGDGRPGCTTCGRPARAHYSIGWYRLCEACHQSGQRSRARWARRRVAPRCQICRRPFPGRGSTCSTVCGTIARRQLNYRHKAFVLAALGGRCVCEGPAGCWHPGPCPVTVAEALTVDHQHGDGGRIRRQRRDGSRMPAGATGQVAWSRYRRALALPDHGMRLLCFNCHQVSETARRRAHLGPAR
jgi:hypothetical protein